MFQNKPEITDNTFLYKNANLEDSQIPIFWKVLINLELGARAALDQNNCWKWRENRTQRFNEMMMIRYLIILSTIHVILYKI